MSLMAGRRTHRQLHRFVPAAIRIPWAKLECAYYVTLLYSLLGDRLGISVPLLAGALILALAGFCIWKLRSCAKALAPIGLLIAFVVSFLLVQVVVHGVSITDESVRPFINWILGLIIVHTLCLKRDFVLRYPLVLFVTALAMVPFLTFSGEIEQAHVDAETGLQVAMNPEWFGFFTIYFAVRGMEDKRPRVQICAWLIGVGCLFVSCLAVSRSLLLALALALTVACRGVLRRGFGPVFLLLMLTGVVSESGLFDKAISHYITRGMEETGRETLWPNAIERIFDSPTSVLFGVGETNILMQLAPNKRSPPHNAFLHFWLSSGVVPFVFFLGFWIHAGWKSTMHRNTQDGDAFRLPYLVFTLVVAMFSDIPFISPWGLLALSVAAGSAVVYRKQLVSERVGNKTRFGLFPGQKSPAPSIVARSQS